ncbi:hypothetical protein HJG60_009506 [Phyllostomus discolor]|uniref:Uncharacterized protein n=1 Tax=Phyllostomus discolor TaxID=89673 RepID=A0A833Y975_9CHIR|nr:hypothetical protein HJG60_009506 [Phyllostomus discolor]
MAVDIRRPVGVGGRAWGDTLSRGFYGASMVKMLAYWWHSGRRDVVTGCSSVRSSLVVLRSTCETAGFLHRPFLPLCLSPPLQPRGGTRSRKDTGFESDGPELELFSLGHGTLQNLLMPYFLYHFPPGNEKGGRGGDICPCSCGED